ncbi:MAG: hypothetical protein NWF01_01640 [Candidatus Bathyarchaeota archaeon]|nr:hypothetical protein [Candidatus Bathyarchaeota archaeon]
MGKVRKIGLLTGLSLSLIGIYHIISFPWYGIVVGILILILGLILIAIAPEGKKEPRTQPNGVTLFGYVAFFSSLIVGFFSYMMVIFGFGVSRGLYLIWFLGFFALTSLPLSILVLRKVCSKYLWHAIMVFLSALLVLSFIRDLVWKIIPVAANQPEFYYFVLPTYIFSISFIIYFLTKKTRQYYGQVGSTFCYTRSVYAGAMVGVSVFLLLIQIFGVPFWWTFSGLNTQDSVYVSSLNPQNPEIGENITFQVTTWVSYKTYSRFYNISNAVITVEANGIKPYTVYADENGVASFVYQAQPTIFRVYDGEDHSLYHVIPATPQEWEMSCFIAVVGAISLGSLAGFIMFKRKTPPQKTSQTPK